MGRQHHRAVQQAGHVDVGDERPGPERQLAPAVALQRLADAAVFLQRGHCPLCLAWKINSTASMIFM